MRRTIPQKGQPVPSRTSEHEAMTTQAKQVLPETNRRVRTSAAVIGLAVSVGAYGMPIPHQGDQAVASEPSTVDPTASNQSSFETAAVFPAGGTTETSVNSVSESAPLVIKHTVQEGQTLWDVARFYGADVSSLANANSLAVDSVLRVGQVLLIPTDTRIAQAIDSTGSSAITPGYYGPVSGRLSDSPVIASAPRPADEADATLKAKQDAATEKLKQKRESLRSSLTALANQQQEVPPTVTTLPSNQVEQSVPALPSTLPTPAASTAPASTTLAQPASEDQEVALRSSGQFAQPSISAVSAVSHQIVPGDTLSTVARKYGVSVNQLIEANRISDPNFIFVGQTLSIPGQTTVAETSNQLTTEVAAVPSSTLTDVPASVQARNSVVLSPQAEPSRVAAVSPFGPPPQQSESFDSNSRLLRYNHVENLKQEIDRLREKYQTQTVRPQSVVPVATKAAVATETPRLAQPVTVMAEPVNPEFNPARYNARLNELRDRMRPAQSPTATKASSANTQVVAVAPLGSENYDPIKSRLGKTVSPELPSLGSGSEFLPGAPGQFNGYIWPTKGVLTSGYGWRWGRMHKGIDIAGPVGTPIVAAADGVVSYSGWNSGGYGYLVEIQHPDGSLTLYAHNSRLLVQVGQQVAQGQQISEMGSTGYSTGPHLHFEVHPSGKGAVNPMAFLPKN